MRERTADRPTCRRQAVKSLNLPQTFRVTIYGLWYNSLMHCVRTDPLLLGAIFTPSKYRDKAPLSKPQVSANGKRHRLGLHRAQQIGTFTGANSSFQDDFSCLRNFLIKQSSFFFLTKIVFFVCLFSFKAFFSYIFCSINIVLNFLLFCVVRLLSFFLI